jgi:hypothetical protein
VGAGLVGKGDRVNVDMDPSASKSSTGYMVTHVSCPMVWVPKLQMEVALSAADSDSNTMSSNTRKVIHVTQLVAEAKQLRWERLVGKETVNCKVFEDNSGALKIEGLLPKMQSRGTKQVSLFPRVRPQWVHRDQ